MERVYVVTRIRIRRRMIIHHGYKPYPSFNDQSIFVFGTNEAAKNFVAKSLASDLRKFRKNKKMYRYGYEVHSRKVRL